MNRRAGSAADSKLPGKLGELLSTRGIAAQIVEIDSPDEARRASVRAVASGACVVVAAGGDGTVSTVASSLVGTAVPLGVLPLGTRNHFAKDLRLPLALDRAVETIVAGHQSRVDVGEVNGHTFVNNSSIGIYPDIVVERESLREQGYRKWTAHAVATARVLRRYPGLVVRIETRDDIRLTRTPILFVGNNEYDLDGVRLGGRQRLDDGRLFAAFAPGPSASGLARVLMLAIVGRASESGSLQSISAAALLVEARFRRMRVALDGEVLTLAAPLRYRILPRALGVLVPAGD